MKQYAPRDAIALDKAGGFYCRHVAAMTAEGLHEKSDIAAELAWRDARIAELEAALEDKQEDAPLEFFEWLDDASMKIRGFGFDGSDEDELCGITRGQVADIAWRAHSGYTKSLERVAAIRDAAWGRK